MVETLALAASNTNPNLKTYIICPGFIYGCGEDLFYEYFKMAWLQDPVRLPVVGEGKNSIPTIHILDLVGLIKRIIEKKPVAKYIFAVDRTKNRSLKNIILNISRSTGSGLIEHVDFPDSNIPAHAELSINVKVKTSKVFEDVKGDDEDQEDFEKRCFKWHSEFGIPGKLEELREEFNLYRNLKPLKILITGPPASGKTFLAERLSKFYNIPHIRIKDIVEYGKTLTDELGEEIKLKTDELRERLIEEMEAAEKKNKGKKKPVTDQIDKTQLQPRLPDDLIIKLLKRKLKENLCRNRGYILDGYPRNFEVCNSTFVEIDENKPEEDPTKYTLLKEILPNAVIKLEHATDDFLKGRIKAMPEFNVTGTHYNEEGMNRRLNSYKTQNESIKGDPSLVDFFFKKKVDVLPLDCRRSEVELLDQAKIFAERNGVINNYQKFDEEVQEEHKQSFENKLESEVSSTNKELNE
jgi:adenylate kinase